MAYLETKLYMPSSNRSSVITIKLNSNENIGTTAMLLFYFPQIIIPARVAYFTMTNYCTSFQGQKLSGLPSHKFTCPPSWCY
jgi:hypothetical protein